VRAISGGSAAGATAADFHVSDGAVGGGGHHPGTQITSANEGRGVASAEVAVA